MVDIHSHFLPAIDDGAKDVEMSSALLKDSEKSGITGLIATPHFYSQESVETFLKKRRQAFEKICTLSAVPIALGAEVYYTHSLLRDTLERLTIGGSEWLLLELPFEQFNERIFNDIQVMTQSMGLKIIIAHVERYIPFNSWSDIERLCCMDVTIQVNASDVENRKVRKLFKEDLVHFVASDMHNPVSRPQNLKEALGKIGNRASMYIDNGDYLFQSLSEVYLKGEKI